MIADICRAFGILPSHPLMRDVQEATWRHGGSYARLLIDMFDRYCPLPPRGFSPPESHGPPLAPAGTGPP